MSPHILVVEDESIAALALEDFLTSNGYRVTLAADGLEGLEALERDPVDAIVTDLRMPRLDGPGMIKRLRDKGLDLPIIVMTGYFSFNADNPALSSSGPAALVVLQKPVNPDEILSSLAQMLP